MVFGFGFWLFVVVRRLVVYLIPPPPPGWRPAAPGPPPCRSLALLSTPQLFTNLPRISSGVFRHPDLEREHTISLVSILIRTPTPTKVQCSAVRFIVCFEISHFQYFRNTFSTAHESVKTKVKRLTW